MSRNPSGRNGQWSAPGLVTLMVVLLLVITVMLFRAKAPAVHPLVPVQRVVVLLVPGASLTDWRNREYMPTLAAYTRGDFAPSRDRGFVGVFPNRLPWRVGNAKLSTLSPATLADFVRACDLLGGESLSAALRTADVRLSALDGDPAARAFLGALTPSAMPPNPALKKVDGGSATDPGTLARAVRREAAGPVSTSLLLAAAFDDLLRCDVGAPLSRPAAALAQRRAALRRLDTLFAQLTGAGPNALPPDTALLILTPVPSINAAERGQLLGPVMVWRRSAPSPMSGSLLTSPSTRYTPGLLAPADSAATILHLLRASEKSPGGRPAVVLGTTAASGLNAEFLAARVADWSAQAREIRLLVTLPWLLAGTLLFAAFFGQGKVRSACILGAVTAPPALLLAAPLASQNPGEEAFVYAVAGLTVLAVSLAGVLPARRQRSDRITTLLRAIFVFTAAVILFDTITGGSLLARSPLSYSPVAAARFYGIGNEISGVFLGASVLAVGVLCPTPLGAAVGGMTVVLICGMPMFGADAGGFLAALAGFGAMFVLLTAARSENKRRASVWAGVGVAVVTLLLLVLYIVGSGRQSAGTRTHVGEAVASAQTPKGAAALLPLIRRKAATAVRLLVTSPWSILLITETGLCARLWRRRSRSDDACHAVCRAVFVTAGTLLLVNDSGVVAAATCLLYPTGSLLLTASPTGPPAADS